MKTKTLPAASDLLERVEAGVLANNMPTKTKTVLVAVSGGVDSMVLLHVLHALSVKHHWKLAVAHFNHQLRGRASERDEQFVRNCAKKWGLRQITGRGKVRTFAQRNKLSIEMAARELRHKFLAAAAVKLKMATIATAHHADDQVELFFLRLLRGAGSAGLAGMTPVGVSPANPNLAFIRPLLEVSKAELEAFAKAERIPFREDASNQSHDFLRNRLRHELLPLLRHKYQPALTGTILRVMDILREESRFVHAAVNVQARRKPQADFDHLAIAVQRQWLQSQLIALGITPDFEMIEHLRAHKDAALTVAPSKNVARDAHGRVAWCGAPLETISEHPLRLQLTGVRGDTNFGEVKFHWGFAPFSGTGGQLPKFSPCREFFDADKVGERICLRHWLPGDRFQPIGMKQPVKLQDLFTNLKVSHAERRRRVLAVAGSGRIFWVEGLRISEEFKLDKTTVRQLKWQWRRCGG